MRAWTIVSVSLVVLIGLVGAIRWKAFQADPSGLGPPAQRVVAKAQRTTAVALSALPETQTARVEAGYAGRPHRIAAAGEDTGRLSPQRLKRRSRAYMPSIRRKPAPEAKAAAGSGDGSEWVRIPGTRIAVWPGQEAERSPSR
jgi:hypothetical protein